jgi:hypothetical protein
MKLPHSEPVSALQVEEGHMQRIKSKISQGAFVVESGNWAAAACWEPPLVAQVSQGNPAAYLTPQMLAARPIFASFIQQIAQIKQQCLSDLTSYWHLSMMGADPDKRKARAPGTVRAIFQPFVREARETGQVIWLEAGNARARDVYKHQGFEVVGVIWSGKGHVDECGMPAEGEEATGVPTWCMIIDPKKERGDEDHGCFCYA